jgi:citrate synthase
MNNSAEPLYLSAGEAATELSVSPATLYAYVSRGLIRSEPGGDNGRSRRYRADDVRSLKNRRAPLVETQGLKSSDLPILDSSISTITEEGPIYRGVNAVVLSQRVTAEQTATLLWDITGPDPFTPENLPIISPAMHAIMTATKDEAPIPRAAAMFALATDADPRAYSRSSEGRSQTGARIMRLAAAAILGTAPSAEPLHIQIARVWSNDAKRAEDFVRRALVLLAEHELNASTFAARVAASTGVSLYDAVCAGLATLKGPKHGGAGPLASRFVADAAGRDPAELIRERLALGELIPGFGHMVYRKGDPRAIDLLAMMAKSGADERYAVTIPALVYEATGELPNIDYAIAVHSRTLGFPAGSEIALFAIARTAGWVAHGIEQLKSKALIRPRARYTGPAPAPARPAKR